MHEGFSDYDSFAESISDGFTNCLNGFVSEDAEPLSKDDGYAILCSAFGDRLSTQALRAVTEAQIIDLQDSLEEHALRLSRQQVVYCLWQALHQSGAISGPEVSEAGTINGDAQPESPMSTIVKAHDWYTDRLRIIKWLTVGPVLVCMGVTQAVYGWAGNSLGMRIGYSAACIIFGLSILAFMIWGLLNDDADEVPSTNMEA